MKILEKIKSGNIIKYKFFGLTILKIKENTNKRKYYFLGIKFLSKNKNVYEIKIDKLQKEIDNLKYNLPIQIQASVVHKYLEKYRNSNHNQDVVIIAGGPSVNYYEPIKNAKHLAINKAVVYDKVKFDYSFLSDKISKNDTNKLVDEYDYVNCEKFYCLIPERRFKQIKNIPNCGQIPMSNYIKSNSNILLLEDMVRHKWARELSFEPLGDFEGTVFSALQFIAYTNPRRIYLVGCDETKGYFFDKEIKQPKIDNYAIPIWNSFKEFIEYEYNNTQIISINPIGLRGIFKDVYTQSFLDDYNEILNIKDAKLLKNVIL